MNNDCTYTHVACTALLLRVTHNLLKKEPLEFVLVVMQDIKFQSLCIDESLLGILVMQVSGKISKHDIKMCLFSTHRHERRSNWWRQMYNNLKIYREV